MEHHYTVEAFKKREYELTQQTDTLRRENLRLAKKVSELTSILIEFTRDTDYHLTRIKQAANL